MPSLTRADSCASEREGWILFVGWFVGIKGKGVVSTSISEDGLVGSLADLMEDCTYLEIVLSF